MKPLPFILTSIMNSGIFLFVFAKVAELADAPDLGSGARWVWGFESPLSQLDNPMGKGPDAHH